MLAPNAPTVSTRALLLDVIASSSQDRLRRVLTNIIATNSDAFDKACDMLLLQQGKLKAVTDQVVQSKTTILRRKPGEGSSNEEYEATIIYSELSDEEPIGDQQGGRKRKPAYTRQRYEVCGQCDEEYDTMHNEENSCIWHDEELQINEEAHDAWEGWDEPEDTDENRNDKPGGFRFPCCDGDGTASGCKSSVHRPDRAKRVRTGGSL